MTCGDSAERTNNVARRIRRQGRRGSRLRTDDLRRTGPRRSGRGPVARTLSCSGRRFGRSWRIFAYSRSSNFGLKLLSGVRLAAGQAILTDTVLHGPMTPVFSLSRHSRADAVLPELPVTFVVMTLEADRPGDTSPGSQKKPSALMANPFGSTHVSPPTTVALVTSVRTRSS